MKLILLILFSVCICFAGHPTATATDTIATTKIQGNTVVLVASQLWIITLTTTPDTLTFVCPMQHIDVIGAGASTDTAMVAFSQAVTDTLGHANYSAIVQGNAAEFHDFNKPYIKKFYGKARSGTCKLWLRGY